MSHTNRMATPFRVLADYGQQMAATRSRIALRRLVAALLNTVESTEIEQTARMIIGRPSPQAEYGALGMSVSAVWRAIEPIFQRPQTELAQLAEGAVDFGNGIREIFVHVPKHPDACLPESSPLTVGDVYSALSQIAALGGSGSRVEKELILRDLLCRASANEAKYIVNNIIGEMRHGVREDMMLEGIAMASAIDPELVRRSYMLIGDLGAVAHLAITEGIAALERLEITPLTPLRPMLAQSVDDIPAAWVKHGGHLALEYKLDGARVQIHRRHDEVRIFTRHLMEITSSLPEIVEIVRKNVRSETAILEGEVVAVNAQGEALPFQELMRRFRRVHDVPRLLQEMPVRLYLFDLLYLNDKSYIEATNEQRWKMLSESVATNELLQLAPRLVPTTVEEGAAFFEQAIDQGHEGLISKCLSSPYSPGLRGSGWLKIKEALTVDLVITAAEWGYGRRAGWLSNYHLSALDIVSGQPVMVGKTFKGLTDQEFREMTDMLMEISDEPHCEVVTVKPEIVVEVAFNQVQRSATYPGGVSLRFARIVRYRPDKHVEDIDTLQTLRDIYTMQTGQPWTEAA